MQLNARIKHKRDTASNWATKNPTPLDGEIIIVETADSSTRLKVGDGSTKYSSLPFVDEALATQISANTSNITTLTNTKVTGVTSATDGNVVVFDGTGGRLIKDSGKSLSSYLPLAGGTMTGNITFSDGKGLKWVTKSSKNPYMGYCTSSSDGTFVIGSLTGTTHQTGLAIGGSSGNLLWQGNAVLTTASAISASKVSGTVASADKANADASGNTITTTYATKTELTDGLDGKLGSTANAVSASKWATARTITLGGDASGSVSIDGSANKTLTVTVKDDSHSHVISNVDGLQDALDGKASTGSVTDAIATAKSYTDTAVAGIVDSSPEALDTLKELATALGDDPNFATTVATQIGTKANSSEVVKLTGDQTIAGAKTFSSTIAGSISGNAGTATKLASAKNISLTGDATGSASFDGSAAASIATTLSNSGVTAGSYGPSKNASPAHKGTFSVPYITVDAKGRVTAASTKTITLPADNDTKYTHPSHTAKSSGLYKITVDSYGHVSAATAVVKADITGLGIPAQDTVYTLPNATDKVLGGVKVGSNITVSSGTISLTKSNVTSALGYTPPTKDTTYSAATTSVAGLMSADDKTKLNGIATGANKYTHPSYTAKSSGLYKVTVDSTGHVSDATAVTKADITGLGIPAQDTVYTLPTASSTLGGVKTTSKVTSTSGLTACPIISGVPYYKDTNTTYTLSSFGVTATSAELNVLDGIKATVTELNYCDGVTSSIQTQLNGKLSTSGTAAKATADASGNVITTTYATKSEVAAIGSKRKTFAVADWVDNNNGTYTLTAQGVKSVVGVYKLVGDDYVQVGGVDIALDGQSDVATIRSTEPFVGVLDCAGVASGVGQPYTLTDTDKSEIISRITNSLAGRRLAFTASNWVAVTGGYEYTVPSSDAVVAVYRLDSDTYTLVDTVDIKVSTSTGKTKLFSAVAFVGCVQIAPVTVSVQTPYVLTESDKAEIIDRCNTYANTYTKDEIDALLSQYLTKQQYQTELTDAIAVLNS